MNYRLLDKVSKEHDEHRALFHDKTRSHQFHYCVITDKRGNIISRGYNSPKTHTKLKHWGYHDHANLHAELSAVIRAGITNGKGYNIIIIRKGHRENPSKNHYMNTNRELVNSAPCKYCRNMIESVGFDKVIYSNNYGSWTEESLKKFY